jgi:hypothetical protein
VSPKPKIYFLPKNVNLNNKKSLFLFIGLMAALLYFNFWWLYKLEVLPGLHGDEAWFGLQAVKYGQQGVTGYQGMNNYTGILEPVMASAFFRYLGIGVIQLRIGGVIANFMALLIFSIVYLRNGQSKALVLFLLILGQSGLYLISPRVAWEVNSFTLLFIALNALAITGILKSNKRVPLMWATVFLATNIIGSYNHIIFSGLSIALLTGVSIWSLYCRTSGNRPLMMLLFTNAFNVCLVYVFLNIYPLKLAVPYVVVSFLFLILLEGIVADRLSNGLKMLDTLNVPKPFIYSVLLVGLGYFAIHHGLAFVDVWSNYKLMMHAYSVELPILLQWLCSAIGILMLLLICSLIMKDVMAADKNSLSLALAFVTISYLGILSFYTTNNSFRYYLIAYALTAIYLSIKIANSRVFINVGLPVILISLIIINVKMGYVYFSPDRQLKALKIPMGNGTVETSAHFLPNKPLVKYLSTNKTGRFYYLSDSYFLGQVIDFYRLASPWQELPENEAIINYDYSPNLHGGYMFYRK